MPIIQVIKDKFPQIVIVSPLSEVNKESDRITHSCIHHKSDRTETVKKLMTRSICCSTCANILNKGHAHNLDALPYNSKKIQQIDLMFNGKFDYSQFTAIDTFTRSTIICREHGPFQASLTEHVLVPEQKGCSKCLKDTNDEQKWTSDTSAHNEKNKLIESLKKANSSSEENPTIVLADNDWMHNAKSLFVGKTA
jgi:hypothetical protein